MRTDRALYRCAAAALAAMSALAGAADPACAQAARPVPSPLAADRDAVVPHRRIDAWFRNQIAASAGDPDRGRRDVCIVFTTAHMALNPLHANAMRRVAGSILNHTLVTGDRVRTVAAEMAPWRIAPPVDLTAAPDSRQAVLDQMPTTPAPGSRGGKDIERTLLTLLAAPARPGDRETIYLVLSNGWSQLPAGGGGGLASEGSAELAANMNARGYRAPVRTAFRVYVAPFASTVYVTALFPAHMAAGGGLRPDRFDPATWVPPAEAPPAEPPAPVEHPFPGAALILACIAATFPATIVTLIMWRRARAPQPPAAAPEPATQPEPAPRPDPEPRTETDAGSAVQDWTAAANRQRRVFDTLAQDMAQAAAELSAQVATLGRSTLDAHESWKTIGELRGEIVAREQLLRQWDETAMDYISSMHSAIAAPGLAPERREEWEWAARSFIRLVGRQGLDVIRPEPGDPVIDDLIRVDRIVTADGTPDGAVVECLQWGFRRGVTIYRQAIVTMAGAAPEPAEGR